MAAKPKPGWSSTLRKGFNLEAETGAEEKVDAVEEIAPLPARPQPEPEPEPLSKTVDFVPLTVENKASGRERGRPKSTVERFPKTVYLTQGVELALRRAVEQMQDWRGRRRGVLKVQESEAASFALEYLYRRMQQGEEAAEDFYRQAQLEEKSRFNG